MAWEEVTQEILKKRLKYLPEGGGFIWKETTTYTRRLLGQKAGGLDKSTGYEKVYLLGKQHYVHRLVWLYHYGELPSDLIDHINGIKTDNRVENLRDADRSINAKNSKLFVNNSSGEVGISWSKISSKWRVYATHKSNQIHGGVFDSFADAVRARDELHSSLGFSATHGRVE